MIKSGAFEDTRAKSLFVKPPQRETPLALLIFAALFCIPAIMGGGGIRGWVRAVFILQYLQLHSSSTAAL